MEEKTDKQEPQPQPMSDVDKGYQLWVTSYLGQPADEANEDIHLILLAAFRAGWAGCYVTVNKGPK